MSTNNLTAQKESREGTTNTVTRDRSAAGSRAPVECGRIGDTKGHDHMKDTPAPAGVPTGTRITPGLRK